MSSEKQGECRWRVYRQGSLMIPLLATLLIHAAHADDEYRFDSAEFDKKPYEFGGYFEQKQEALHLRGDSSAYRLTYPGQAALDELNRSTTTLELSGRANFGSVLTDIRAQTSYASDPLAITKQYGQVMEGGMRWSAGPKLSLDIGKRVLRWGKGYAWNPVGFVERPKDLTDPLASREGYVMAGGEWTQSQEGVVSTITLSALILPTHDNLNKDFGKKQDLNPAAKAYLLLYDTDIDLMWRAEGARSQSFGVDFSRNLTSALEVHGEWARTEESTREMLNSQGELGSERLSYNAWLLGARYITNSEITWIVEYYRNGAGYSANQLGTYYDYLDQTLTANSSPLLFNKARSVSLSGYGKPNPGQNYLYAKASLSEPLNWLYSTLSLSTIVNLDDRTWQIQPELSYTGFSNWEIRARMSVLGGAERGEFTTKMTTNKFEVYARYSF